MVSPNMVTEMQGSNVKAVCQATGSPPPEIQWNLDMIFTHYEVSWFPLVLSLAADPLGVLDHERPCTPCASIQQ